MKAIAIGDVLPLFEAKDQFGNNFNIGTVLGKKVLVLYFYPKDDTPGCTRQACFFRDQYEEFKDLGAEVIGISGDSVKAHEKFAKTYNLPFTLLSDSNKKLRKLFGVPTNFLGLLPGRVTYIIDKQGVVQMIFDSMKAENHFSKTVEEVKRLMQVKTEKTMYPLVFQPIVKDRIWGGTKLKTELNKNIVSSTTGESWEISTVPGDVSIVANGDFSGLSINELIEKYPTEILGAKVYEQFGTEFPLLFKFLDAKEDLSIQLHPNDELAKKRHNSFGKTEMWYVMQADAEARIIVGFKEKSSSDEYLTNLENKTLPSILNEIPVKKGDVFFLETGTIHAIGAGIVIAEIQQTSDVTYRIYDWDRVDAQGNSRELHIEQALDAITYDVVDAQRNYESVVNKSNPAVECPYFTTNVIPLDGKIHFNKEGKSFTVLVCTEGEFCIETKSSGKYSFQKGDTVLLPAVLTDFEVVGKATLLEIFIS